jgi:hypothetical protein
LAEATAEAAVKKSFKPSKGVLNGKGFWFFWEFVEFRNQFLKIRAYSLSFESVIFQIRI